MRAPGEPPPMRYLAAVDTVHTAAAICDYLQNRLADGDEVHAVTVHPRVDDHAEGDGDAGGTDGGGGGTDDGDGGGTDGGDAIGQGGADAGGQDATGGGANDAAGEDGDGTGPGRQATATDERDRREALNVVEVRLVVPTVETGERRGAPGPELLAAAADADVDEVVVGARAGTPGTRGGVGSTASAVLEAATRPVVVVPLVGL